MYEEPIVSLCYISSVKEKTVQLCRIADYEHGEFIPYHHQPDIDFWGTDRDILVGQRYIIPADLGSIGVYEWTVRQDHNTGDWWTNVKPSDQSWVEFIPTYKQASIDEIRREFQSGLTWTGDFDRTHSYAFIIKGNGNSCEFLYVSGKELVYRDGRLFLASDTTFLMHERIENPQSYSSCRCRYSPLDPRFYLCAPQNCVVIGKVQVSSTDAVIRDVIKQFINHLDKCILSRSQKQNARSALDKIAVPTVAETIAEKLQCSLDDARKLLEAYIRTSSTRIEKNEAELLISILIRYDTDLVEELRQEVKTNWLESNQLEVDAANEAIAERRRAYDEICGQITKSQSQLSIKEQEIHQAEEKVNELLQMQDDIEQEIQNRLHQVQTDRAKALVEVAWMQPATRPERTPDTPLVHKGYTLVTTTNPLVEESTNLRGCIEDAQDAFHTLTDHDELAQILTSFFFSAYIARQNLVITGECAILLADLYSQIITGRKAAKLTLSANPDIGQLVDEVSASLSDFVCVMDGFQQGYSTVQTLIRQFPNKQFVITARHEESLFLEPPSLFTTYLPVLSDTFCAVTDIGSFELLSCRNDITSNFAMPSRKMISRIRAAQQQWFADDYFAPLLINRCAQLQAIGELLPIANSAVVAERMACMMVFVPLMKLLRKKERIATCLETTPVLSEEQKQHIRHYVGIEEG